MKYDKVLIVDFLGIFEKSIVKQILEEEMKNLENKIKIKYCSHFKNHHEVKVQSLHYLLRLMQV